MQGLTYLVGDGIIEHAVFSDADGGAVGRGKYPLSNRLTLLT
jgi:hypothetical protein